MEPNNAKLLPILAAVAAEMRGGPPLAETLNLRGPDLALAVATAIDVGLVTNVCRPELTAKGLAWAAVRLDGLRPLLALVETAEGMAAAEMEVAADA